MHYPLSDGDHFFAEDTMRIFNVTSFNKELCEIFGLNVSRIESLHIEASHDRVDVVAALLPEGDQGERVIKMLRAVAWREALDKEAVHQALALALKNGSSLPAEEVEPVAHMLVNILEGEFLIPMKYPES